MLSAVQVESVVTKDSEILDLAKTLIETFGASAPRHALQLAASLKAANRDRAARYELAAEVSKQMLAAAPQSGQRTKFDQS
jgi:hypothetical protein